MDNFDKAILLQDLCARLPYDVKGRVYSETTNGEYDINGDMIFFDSPFDVTLDGVNTSTEEIHVVAIGNEDTVDFIEDQQTCGSPYTLDEFKPYLRPMSSMTEEEKKELINIRPYYVNENDIVIGVQCNSFAQISECQEWLNKKMFDYRGLIEKGLALEAPDDVYSNGITCYNVPPYSLTVDKDKVPEVNLEPPEDKSFYMDFNIKEK